MSILKASELQKLGFERDTEHPMECYHACHHNDDDTFYLWRVFLNGNMYCTQKTTLDTTQGHFKFIDMLPTIKSANQLKQLIEIFGFKPQRYIDPFEWTIIKFGLQKKML